MADKWAAQAKAEPKAEPVGVRDVIEALVLDLSRLNHPLPLTQKKLDEWTE